jgi:hypothetical protein
MSGTAELRGDAAQALIRAELLIDRADVQLGETFQTALEAAAADCERLRRRLGAQTLASTGTGGADGG